MHYDIQPIYTLLDKKPYRTAYRNLKLLQDTIMDMGVECANKRCHGNGTCIVDRYFFDSLEELKSYRDLFKNKTCICDKSFMGNNCNNKYDESLFK